MALAAIACPYCHKPVASGPRVIFEMEKLKMKIRQISGAWLVLLALSVCAAAQSTSFTYQGRLTNAGSAANGNYDLQFVLFDSLANGTQIGVMQTVPNVAVSAGIFTVQLDFGAAAFPNANRFLEIG